MNTVSTFLETTAADIARRTSGLGARVMLDASVIDRSDSVALDKPRLWSANGACRLIRARDGWIAANLPRDDDRAAVPALVHEMPANDVWAMLVDRARTMACVELTSRAEMLGIALAAANETPRPRAPCAVEHLTEQSKARAPLRVVDFSSLWAGPLCGAIFARMGAEVTKIESVERPDTTADAAPLLEERLNGAKRKLRLPISTAEGLRGLCDAIARSDVLITSARARALHELGLTRERLFAANPALVWVAITGHGWQSDRIAFGDDAAAAGGLLAWENGEPRFIADAMADPLTGVAAAASALHALERGGGAFIDAGLAQVAAYVAAGDLS